MKTMKYLLAAVALLALGASPALANESGTWTVYMGAGTVQPDTPNLSFADPFDEASIDLEVEDASSLTLGATYFINENWAFDVFGALPFKHDITAVVSAPGEDTEAFKIGSTKQIPPTVSIQYHFTTEGGFDPYVGIGANYTRFSSEELIDDPTDEIPEIYLDLDNSLGIAAQVGGDWVFDNNWLLNFDVRFIDIESDATLFGPGIEDLGIEELPIGSVDVDPWLYSINLGYHFE